MITAYKKALKFWSTHNDKDWIFAEHVYVETEMTKIQLGISFDWVTKILTITLPFIQITIM